jgi:sialate O-acetylesterase
MIGSWRKAWQKEFPFTLCRSLLLKYGNKNVGALLRNNKQSPDLPGTGMVVITDLVDDIKNIHPANKKDVADGSLIGHWRKPIKKP